RKKQTALNFKSLFPGFSMGAVRCGAACFGGSRVSRSVYGTTPNRTSHRVSCVSRGMRARTSDQESLSLHAFDSTAFGAASALGNMPAFAQHSFRELDSFLVL